MFARSIEKGMIARLALLIIAGIFIVSCDSKVEGVLGNADEIKDLPFAKAEESKVYADLILKAIRTNRDKPIYDEMMAKNEIDFQDFNSMIGMYSTAIIGREDWDFRDVSVETGKKDGKGFDYAWLDPRGRLGFQIYIEPEKVDGQYKLAKLELRSRLDVMESVAFPGGPIDDYKKLAFNWEQK